MSAVVAARPSGVVRWSRSCWRGIVLLTTVLRRLLVGVRYSWRVLILVDGLWLLWAFTYTSSRAVMGGAAVACAVYLVPLLVGVVWSLVNPFTFERRVAAPWRRWRWRTWARKNWDVLARECGLSV
ncbi:hypothetical protein [Luteococcus sp.]|uniref:hypothetical protein n=1 Tax=Luteococcus sp. TaxID=1969402 RepID=UPI0037357051